MTLNNDDKEPLVFDDDPLDDVLYAERPADPTPADFFLPIKNHMRKVRKASQAHDNSALLSALTVISKENMALHQPICDEIIDITEALIPNIPLPSLTYDIVSLTPLLERIWALPGTPHGYKRRRAVGDRLYRCYEHQRRYADARQILHRLIQITQERGERTGEAVYTNNFAFEYLLEKRWKDAMPLFQRAEKLFFDEGDDFQGANSQANFMTCIFSLRPACELTEHEPELRDLAHALSKDNDWRARKPLNLLSQIRESQGNIDGAIQFMQCALSASEGDNLRWSEIDQARLAELETKK